MVKFLNYKPPPTCREYIKRHAKGKLFYTWIVGPYGSGKTVSNFMKLLYMAKLQEPSPDGIRYSRAVVVRNTMPQLKDTTLASWGDWFKAGESGEWIASENMFIIKAGDIECEVIFRPLDNAADIQRVLGLEVAFAIVDEFREIRREIIEGLSGRLGRGKLPGGVKITNWGMWGASNPGTEDLWWYDYLNSYIDKESGLRKGCIPVKFPFNSDRQAKYEEELHFEPGTHAWYFHQPSGLSPDAENLPNLPPFDGSHGYYTDMAKGKSSDWIKQFIDAEWGFSVTGQPVAAAFNSHIHVSRSELTYNRHLPIIVGLDPGLGGSAFVFMQQDLNGRLNVLGELVQRGIGMVRLVEERFQPYVSARFPGARFIFAPDPAAANRSSNDEKSAVQVLRARNFNVVIETNNRLPLRVNAVDHFCNKMVQGAPALQIDPTHCPVLLRALKGGWRYAVDTKKDIIKGVEPEDNPFTHVGDAFGYGCRYYHKGLLKEERDGQRPFVPPNYQSNPYHVR